MVGCLEETEREGFEPSVPVRVHFLSREAPSATQPSFQRIHDYSKTFRMCQNTECKTALHWVELAQYE